MNWFKSIPINGILSEKRNIFITDPPIYQTGDGMESLTASKEYQEGVKKVGPGSVFYYRSIFDPVPSSELKDPKKYGVGAKTDAC